MLKNTAGQGLYVYAFDSTTGLPVTGDAANITAVLSKGGGADVATNDANPTEIGRGRYWFDLTQAETNADALALAAESTTPDVVIEPVIVYTDPNVPQTGDAFARLGAPAGASHAADVAAVKTVADAVQAKTDALPADPADASEVAALIAALPTDADVQSAAAAALAAYAPPTRGEATSDKDEVLAAVAAIPEGASQASVDAMQEDVDAIKAKTDTIGAGSFTVSSPVNTDPVPLATIVQGDDYAFADGRQLPFAIEGLPDLDGATGIFKVGAFEADVTLVTTGAGIEQTMYVELTNAETAAWEPGLYGFDLQFTKATRVFTVQGRLRVLKQQA